LDFQIQHLHQYYDSVKPQLQLQKEENEQKRREADAVATKYPFRQTTYLTEWIIYQAHKPYPSPEEVEKLSMGSGLSALQVSHWATNVRKRNQQATVSRGKKPGGYLDYAFIAASRDCGNVQRKRRLYKLILPTLDTEDRKQEEEGKQAYLAPKRNIRNVEADGVVADVPVVDSSQPINKRLPPVKISRSSLRIQIPYPGSLMSPGQSVSQEKGGTPIMSNRTPSTLFLPTEVTSCDYLPPATAIRRKRPVSTTVPIVPSKRSCTAGPVSPFALDTTPRTAVAASRKLARPYHRDDRERGAALVLSVSEAIHGDKNRQAQAPPPSGSAINAPSCAILPKPEESSAVAEPKSLLTKLSEGNETLLGMLSAPWFGRQQPDDTIESSKQDEEGNNDA
jgi:hypothetical protein